MKRKNPIAAAASKTPSVVLSAFAPDTEYDVSLDAWIYLEALESPFTTAQKPGLRDLVIAAMVFTDLEAVRAARKTGRFEKLIADATAGRRPADVINLTEKVGDAIRAAFEPVDSGVELEKKSSLDADGG